MSIPDPDKDWLRRCARGDESALKLLIAKHQALIFGVAKRFLGSSEDAEEVTISTFLKAWKSAGTFRGDCSVKAYLCQIALNLCKDRPRPPTLTGLPATSDLGLEDARFDRVMVAMQSLAAEDREVLVLYYLDEMTYEEIGHILGMNYDTLKTRLVRARKRLRTLMEVNYV